MVVENPLSVKRTDEFVVLKVADLKEIAPDFSQNTFIVLQADSNQEIPNQLDDMNNDGEGDEIAMIMDMEPREKKKIVFRYSSEGRAVTLGYKKRTRAAVHPEYEGIGWESELIAYRVHPDHRNSVCVFGKQTPGLSLDKFAAGGEYNRLKPWGVNILDGGNSTGCGGFGVWHENRLVKPSNMISRSLPKPGDEVARYTRVVADGPVRSVAQVIFDNWRIGDQKLRVTSTYSIFAGQRWTSCQIRIEGANEPIKIASGLIRRDDLQVAPVLVKDERNGILYTWGARSDLNPPDNMGIALIYPTESFDSFHEDDKSGSYLVVLNPGADNEIGYWFLSAWNRGESGVKKDTQFAELVSSVAQNIRHPLTVTIMPVESKSK